MNTKNAPAKKRKFQTVTILIGNAAARALDGFRGQRSRADIVRDALDAFLLGKLKRPMEYAEWCRQAAIALKFEKAGGTSQGIAPRKNNAS